MKVYKNSLDVDMKWYCAEFKGLKGYGQSYGEAIKACLSALKDFNIINK